MQLKSLTAATAAALALCACSGKDAPKADSAKVSQAGAATPASGGSFDPAARVLTVYAKDYSYGMPDTITAGWTTIHLVNDGTQLHHVQIFRLDSAKTMQDLTAAFKNPGPPPRWAVPVGGPNAPDPAKQDDATLDLPAGNYAVVCMVDLGDGVPHFAKGMIHPLTVTANASDASKAPAADVDVALTDYAFAVTGKLDAGKHVIKVTNKGPQPHEVEFVRLADGKTLKDLETWIDKPQGPPPGSAIGGVSAIVPGMANYASVDLAPGHYAMLCFLPDAKDGKRHVEHGMAKEFTVN